MNLLDRARKILTHQPTHLTPPPPPPKEEKRRGEKSEKSEESPSPGDAALAEVLALIDAALTRTTRPSRKSLLAVYASLARRYHAGQDSLLCVVGGAVRNLLNGWEAPKDAANAVNAGRAGEEAGPVAKGEPDAQ